MKEFKDKNLNDRLQNATVAKRAMLEKMRAKPKADDPEVVARRAAQQAIATERGAENARRAKEKMLKERERVERETADAAARLVREKEDAERRAKEKAERESAQKAARDARYAARKKRGA